MRRITLLLLVCCGCNAPYRGYDVLGPDEFVLDSYKIREGKNAVLELTGAPLPSLAQDLLTPYVNHLQDGDLLTLRFHQMVLGDPLTGTHMLPAYLELMVDQGQLLLPELGACSVAHLTLEEAQRLIQQDYLKLGISVEVLVTFRDRQQHRAELMGMVQMSSCPVYGNTRLYDVLAEARVAHRSNFYASYLLRNGRPLPVDFHKLVVEGDMSQNVVLRGGDKIFVADPAETSVMVLGEVTQQKAVPMTKPFINLREALAEAGGIPFTGDRRFIQVIRGNVLKPRIYTLNWLHVIHLPNDSLLLMPGDVVYVATTPITEWSRFINQLIPGGILFDYGTRGVTTLGGY